VANVDPEKLALIGGGESRLRLQTIVRLRWLAVMGQLAALSVVFFGLGFPLPMGLCLSVIALSAWLNVFLSIQFPARHRLSASFATMLLAYDILQLAVLLYLTGGIENPFTVLIVAPVTVSAATLPPRNTVLLGVVAAAAATLLVFHYHPLPWYQGMRLQMPLLYKLGILAATVAGMVFLALYAWRLSKEGRQMTAALAATEHVLAREQKLHALDGLAAAAAHELGTPLATIKLVSTELAEDLADRPSARDDALLIRDQAERCGDILRAMGRSGMEDAHIRTAPASNVVEEAAAPHADRGVRIVTRIGGAPVEAGRTRQPELSRRPEVIQGLRSLVQNAVDFAGSTVWIDIDWSPTQIRVAIGDDGPGYPPDLIGRIGEPFMRRRGPQAARPGYEGMGLGLFIAKALLERSGAELSFRNGGAGDAGPTGAVAAVTWRRAAG